MEFGITLAKMPTYYSEVANYLIKADDDFIKINPLVGRQVSLEFLEQKFCASCGNQFKDLFRMGFCRECFFSKPEAGESIIRPELSRAHEGEEDRDLSFERSYQLQPHVVYLANSGGLKVGVTRARQKLHRWIDQGASQALVFAETSNRFEAGQIEVAMKALVADKTNWQRMLKDEYEKVDLLEKRTEFAQQIPKEWQRFVSDDPELFNLEFPVKQYPAKVKSINLDKQKRIEAKLQGVRGQYFIFEGGAVINIRSHTGYRVSLGVS